MTVFNHFKIGATHFTYAENDPGIVILRPVNDFISLLRISNEAPLISFFSLPWYFSSKSSLLQNQINYGIIKHIHQNFDLFIYFFFFLFTKLAKTSKS